MGLNKAEISIRKLLRYLLITVEAIKFEKVSPSCEILGLFFSTLTTGQQHSLLNRDNLTQPIQMQLSLKGKTFSDLFSPFLKCR